MVISPTSFGFQKEKPLNKSSKNDSLITHNAIEPNLAAVVADLKSRIIKEGNKPDSTVKEQLELLDQLTLFGFGRCLIVNGGITGIWTRHMVLYPKWRTELPDEEKSLTVLNRWLLEKSPVILATQERFTHFQKLLQEHARDRMKIASIPCGVMDDLLTLDLSKMPAIKLIGIDLDEASLESAKNTAKKYNLEKQSLFKKSDAWALSAKNEFDIITSNGLNFYEPNNEKVVELYKKFYTALKPNGILITSFLTPPPALSAESSWNMEKINSEDLRLQKVIMAYILSVRFQSYRTEKQTIQQLKEAGFNKVSIIYDKARLFPTIMAIK